MSPASAQASKADIHGRTYLHDHEVARLVDAVKKSDATYALRDALLILISYKHGLRSCEAAALLWTDVCTQGRQYSLNIRRAKHRGNEFDEYSHPLSEEEIRMLKRLQQTSTSPYVFTSRKGSALDTRSIRRIVEEAGKLAGFDFDVHPHMLRHATGYQLANSGVDTRGIQEYLGHKNIQSTTRYTKLSAKRMIDIAKHL